MKMLVAFAAALPTLAATLPMLVSVGVTIARSCGDKDQLVAYARSQQQRLRRNKPGV